MNLQRSDKTEGRATDALSELKPTLGSAVRHQRQWHKHVTQRMPMRNLELPHGINGGEPNRSLLLQQVRLKSLKPRKEDAKSQYREDCLPDRGIACSPARGAAIAVDLAKPLFS